MFSSIHAFNKDLKYLKILKVQKVILLPMVFKISNFLIESQLIYHEIKTILLTEAYMHF